MRSNFLLSAVLTAGLLATACSGPVMQLMSNQVQANIQANLPAELPDGLHALICGAGGPLADPSRSGPCVVIIAGNNVVLIDSGSAAARNMNRFGIRPGQIDAVFLTHFHSDHIDGLGEVATLRWAGSGRSERLPVFGPGGVSMVVAGFNLAYKQDQRYRTDHHGETVAPPGAWGLETHSFETPQNGERPVVYENDGLEISAFLVDHDPVAPAVGYRVEYKGRSLVVSGDTAKSANLIEQAKGTDLLIHEALSPKLVGVMNNAATEAGNANIAKITDDILNYHASPVEAAESAEDAGADYLLFYHIVPPLPLSALESIYLEGVSEAYSGDFSISEDGTFVSLPTQSDDIDIIQR